MEDGELSKKSDLGSELLQAAKGAPITEPKDEAVEPAPNDSICQVIPESSQLEKKEGSPPTDDLTNQVITKVSKLGPNNSAHQHIMDSSELEVEGTGSQSNDCQGVLSPSNTRLNQR